ncbi:MAG: chromosomal replication initiator protein DnaA [Clostridia bacterium]
MADLTPYLDLWNRTLIHIRDYEPDMKETSYQSWFVPLKVVDFKNGKICLGTGTGFILDWINNNYHDMVAEHLSVVSDGKVTDFKMVLLAPDGSYDPEEGEIGEKEDFSPTVKNNGIRVDQKMEEIDDLYTTSLNPRYTFDTFVVGDNNRFAHAASLAVAEMPNKVYNPLFIQGGVGLGKTHLMQAIGHFIKENNRNAKVAYFTTENFVNEWICAIKNNTPEQFRSKYRKVDVILMDDIQFLANKDSCQEEFFHTYNALFNSGAQIILSSDRPPYQIPTLEERLVSRFMWGLTTEIQSPDLETRIAILQKKAALNNIVIPHNEMNILTYIANQYDTNVRVLEGALNRVVAYSKMKGEPITLSNTMQALENYAAENRRKDINIDLIIQSTATHFKINPEDLRGQRRTAHITFPRQIAMYLSRELTKATFEKIGEEFGNRHYSTVMHAYNEIADRMKSDQATVKHVKELTQYIRKL